MSETNARASRSFFFAILNEVNVRILSYFRDMNSRKEREEVSDRTTAMRPSQKLYEFLDLDHRVASKHDVRRAYHKKALETHPDKNSHGNHTEFQRVNQAYSILIDDAKRIQYDENASMDSLFSHRSENVFGRSVPSYFDLNAFFDDVLHKSQGEKYKYDSKRCGKSERFKQSTVETVKLNYRQVQYGLSEFVPFRMQQTCMACDGSGIGDAHKRDVKCCTCLGSGTRMQRMSFLVGISTLCTTCGGSGHITDRVTCQNACGKCDGSGTLEVTKNVHVKLPGGASQGKMYKIRNESGVSDLVFRTEYDESCRGYSFDYDSGNVYIEVPLSLMEVLTGFKKTVRISGEWKMISSGKKLQENVEKGGITEEKGHEHEQTTDEEYQRKKNVDRRQDCCYCYRNPSIPLVFRGGGILPPPKKNRDGLPNKTGDFFVKFNVEWPDEDPETSILARRLLTYRDVITRILDSK